MERLIAIILCTLCLPIWGITVISRSLLQRELPGISINRTTGLLELTWANQVLQFPLMTVALGYLRLTGPAPGSPHAAQHAPGIYSPQGVRSSMGLDPDHTDATFFESASTKARLGLAARALFVKIYGQHQNSAAHDEVRIFGVQFHNTTMLDAVSTITGYCQQAQSMKRVFFVNADCLNVAYRDRDYHYLLHNADLVLPDGSGVRMALKSLGTNMLDNLNGTDLFPHLCQEAARKNLSIYLLGGDTNTAERAAKDRLATHPGLKIAGFHDGYFNEGDSQSIVEDINKSGADILLVGLGAPRQERWLSQYGEQLAPSVGIGVGGLFDYYSGNIVRAPLWMRELGLEWVWRILQQPGDKWRRYILGNPTFLARIALQRLSLGKRSWLALGRKAKTHKIASSGYRLASITTRAKLQFWRISIATKPLIKRALDLTLAMTAIVALAPLFTTLALAIKLTSRGPVFFKQIRVGERGELFEMWKFRSMRIDAEKLLPELHTQNESEGQVLFKIKRDPRITPVGRWMRRYSMDELPQLFNVLQGTMSLVGPRPALPSEVDAYKATHLMRLQSKPGLTCWWQVSGRSNLSFNEQMELDVEYLRKQSFTQDITLLAKTVPAVISGRGAF